MMSKQSERRRGWRPGQTKDRTNPFHHVWHADPRSAALGPTLVRLPSEISPKKKTTQKCILLPYTTPGQWHRLLPQLWGVCLAAVAAHSGEGCGCKLQYILYSGLFPAGAAWIMFSWHFHCFQRPPPPSAQWAAQCDAGAQFLHHRQTVQTGGGFSAFDVEFWTCCRAAPHGTFPWHFLFYSIHLVLLFFRLPLLWEAST